MADTPKGPEFLTKKVGPFPVLVWAILAVGAYYWYTHYGPGASKSAASTTAADTAGVVVGYDSQGNPIYAGSVTQSDTGGAPSQYADDAAWAGAAVAYLTGIGVASGDATTAIDNYLQGRPNTAADQANVQLALNNVGPPPIAAPATSTTPSPGPGPKPKPKPKPKVPPSTNIYADARAALIRKGDKHPTRKQINEERGDILETAKQADLPGDRKPRRTHQPVMTGAPVH